MDIPETSGTYSVSNRTSEPDEDEELRKFIEGNHIFSYLNACSKEACSEIIFFRC